MSKFLGSTGLAELIAKIKATFWKKADVVEADVLDIDTTPTANSNNLVTSGGVYSALSGKEDSIDSVTVSVDDNTGTPTGSATLSGGVLAFSFGNLKGATGANGQSSIRSKVSHTSSETSVTGLAWDSVHVWPEMSSLTFTLATIPSDGVEHLMTLVFDTPADVTNFALNYDSSILWGNGDSAASNIEGSKRYEVTISSVSLIALYTVASLPSNS